MTQCEWCPTTFPPKPGKKFCGPRCKDAFHRACRLYTHEMLRRGLMTTMEALKALSEPCTAKDGGLER